MLQAVILGLALLVAVALGLRWFANAEPGEVARALRWIAGIAGAFVLAYLILTERWGLLPFLLFVALPWWNRIKTARRLWKRARGAASGQRSEVETRFLRMTLDHDTGATDGEVREGAQAGRRLGALGMAELRALLAEVAGDADSVRLLQAHLDRAHPGWRDGEAAGPDGAPPGAEATTREEAWRVLGLEPGADETQIREAHRRLMAKLHPDRGGSDYLAAKINQAKDLLLGV